MKLSPLKRKQHLASPSTKIAPKRSNLSGPGDGYARSAYPWYHFARSRVYGKTSGILFRFSFMATCCRSLNIVMWSLLFLLFHSFCKMGTVHQVFSPSMNVSHCNKTVKCCINTANRCIGDVCAINEWMWPLLRERKKQRGGSWPLLGMRWERD